MPRYAPDRRPYYYPTTAPPPPAPPPPAPESPPAPFGDASAAPFAAPAPPFAETPVAEPVAAWEPAPAPPEPPVFTVEEPPTAWTEPEIIPPAFDPDASLPPAAVPVEPVNGNGHGHPAGATAFDDGLPHRAPGQSPFGHDPARSTLPQRDPGNHLSHRPDGNAPAPGEYDARPRPERVHDLLTRHLRGIRDGRDEQVGGVAVDPIPDPLDPEARP